MGAAACPLPPPNPCITPCTTIACLPPQQARPCAPVLAPQRRAAAALGAAALVLSAPWAPALAADLKLGRQVFEQNCAVCHAGGLNSIAGEEKHTLKRDALERYNLYSVEGIATQVHFLGLDKVCAQRALRAQTVWHALSRCRAAILAAPCTHAPSPPHCFIAGHNWKGCDAALQACPHRAGDQGRGRIRV